VIQRLAVVGMGLLGGSVAKAARERNLAREIIGVGRDARRLRPALADGTLDHATTDLAAGVRGADLVVLAPPVQTLERLLPAVWAAASPEALITDVGSTKASIVATAERLAGERPLAFVGSHPMAGGEQSGYAVARADLFTGATVIVTPTECTDSRAVKSVTVFWEALGAHVAVLDPHTHDRVVSAISHLPHLVAYALVEAAARVESSALDFAARGFKDTTRIAASDPDVWREIFLANRGPLREGLSAFRAVLDEVERLVEAGDAAGLRAWLAAVKARRESVR
jgi:prephenate dehydrogenase